MYYQYHKGFQSSTNEALYAKDTWMNVSNTGEMCFVYCEQWCAGAMGVGTETEEVKSAVSSSTGFNQPHMVAVPF